MGEPPNQVAPLRLNSLQSLRGLAAFLVLIFHIADIQKAGLPHDVAASQNMLSGIWERGYVGVDLFFVISGFIMVYVTRNTGRSRAEIVGFLKSRATRVYPLWWFFAGLMALYFWVAYGVPADPFRISGSKEVGVYLLKSMFLLPQEHLPVLSVGWTLIHEVYFYLIFAFILCLPRRYLPAALCFWAAGVLLIFAAGFAKPMVNSIPSLSASLLSLEFIGGGFIGILIARGENRFAGVFAILGAISLVLAMLLYSESGPDLMLWGRVAMFSLPCMALVYGLTALENLGNLKIPALFVSIGDWSYSLYLSHILVLSAIKRIYAKSMSFLPDSMSQTLSIGSPGVLDNIVLAILGIISCLVFAALSHRYIERPLIVGSRNILRV